MSGPSVLRGAHGTGRDAILRAEEPPLDENPPLSPADARQAIAVSARVGKPFAKGNKAGSLRGSALTKVTQNVQAPEDQRRVDRRAVRLSVARQRELRMAHGGGKLSAQVCVEVVAWARATAWSDHFYRMGDAKAGAAFAEKASAHGLRAVGLAAREGAAKPKATSNADPLARWYQPGDEIDDEIDTAETEPPKETKP
jgi:hypothetical protein